MRLRQDGEEGRPLVGLRVEGAAQRVGEVVGDAPRIYLHLQHQLFVETLDLREFRGGHLRPDPPPTHWRPGRHSLDPRLHLRREGRCPRA
ncbi:hypothetical protein L6R49_27180, partial [Myxococcota bacterium]|nr:hypothetical protein [Myxococcota bacterium]